METSSLADEVAAFFADPSREPIVPLYHRMRDEDPVHHSRQGPWLVTSYELARSVVTSKEFVRTGAHGTSAQRSDGSAASFWNNQIVHLDDPDHSRLRSLAQKAFTVRAVSALREQAEKILGDQLDHLRPRGEMELIGELSYPFTVEVICGMVGVPLSMGPTLVQWVHRLISGNVPTATDEQVRIADRTATEAFDFFGRLAEERRIDPRDDLFTGLVEAEELGDRLTHTELMALTLEMAQAGHETTANMIPNAMMLLLRHPDQLELLRARPELMPSAVEECLRYEPSVRLGLTYIAASDVVLGDTVVPKGDQVNVWLSAANRDPAMFDEPDRFDVTRAPNKHLSFSLGAHFCLGHALARMETAVALTGLLTLPGLALVDDDLRWRKEWYMVRALESLRVRWDT